MNRRRVVVTGMGVVSPFGIGSDAFWNAIANGRSAARLIDSFDTCNLPVRFAADVPLSDAELEAHIENLKATKTMSRAGKFAVIACAEAVKGAGVDRESIDPYRFGTSLGMGGLGLFDREYVDRTFEVFADSFDAQRAAVDRTRVWRNTLDYVNPLTPLKALPNIATAHLAINHDARGPSLTLATACTSGTQAAGEAFRLIQSNVCDAVLAGGADSMVNPNGIVAFSALGVLSRNNEEHETAARPFDRRRDGFMLGEGAAVFVFEELECCRARGARPLAEVIGYAATSDAYRLTDEPRDGRGSVAAMRLALKGAEVSPSAVDYINAHGTGTPMNDRTETLAIRTVFGDHARRLPVSSTKSMIGHLVAAAGAVELAACIGALSHGVIPPTINYEAPDPDCDLDCVPNEAREAPLRVVLSNSFGFGGQNACVLLRSI